ncbi:hypothetical protein [Streptomyces hydrogenans]|uniref:hypothetical protein n=1 Tax=Streptomyces hydrogenans TaxID=1873719 RepID=UPI00381A4832
MRSTPDGIPQIASLEEFNVAVADTMREFGISAMTAKRFLVLTLGFSVIYEEPTAQAEFTAVFQAAVTDKEPWALEYFNANLARTVAPYRETYQRAVQLGADPVISLQVAHGITEDVAREAVTLRQQESDQ